MFEIYFFSYMGLFIIFYILSGNIECMFLLKLTTAKTYSNSKFDIKRNEYLTFFLKEFSIPLIIINSLLSDMIN